MDIQHESREDREQAMRNISVDLAEIAETDLNLPFSLMKDAWGICFQSGNTTPMVQEWAYALVQAIRAYRENPEGYRQSTVLWGKEIEKPLI